MFERFTQGARQVVVAAQDEARDLKHSYLGTEHLLLGLLREEEGAAARVLTKLGVTLEESREKVIAATVPGLESIDEQQLPFTPRTKKVLELALREALTLGHNYLGTEHLLLGLMREESTATRVLGESGITEDVVRSAVIQFLTNRSSAHEQEWLSPPLSLATIAEIARLKQVKERAIEDGDFERAATFRSFERMLVQAARELERVWLRIEAESSSAAVSSDAASSDAARGPKKKGKHREHKTVVLDVDDLDGSLAAALAGGWKFISVVSTDALAGPVAFFRRSTRR